MSTRPQNELFGRDQRIMSLLDVATRAAASDATVLIRGENGSGKTSLATYIHAQSARAGRRPVTINCATFPNASWESDVFGDTFASAIGSTVILDEIADLPLWRQGILLDTLNRADRDLASSDSGPTNVRVVATASRKLPELVASGQFRRDLLLRLRIIELVLPPLRDRRADIPLLVAHFASRLRPVVFSPAAIRLLEGYRWPGNVRELQNVVQHAVFNTDESVIPADALPTTVRASANRIVLQQDRRSRTAEELYEALVGAGCSFWNDIHPLFLSRDITRHDVRELVRLGLANARGSYRNLLTLFGIAATDYKRFLNFLAAHDCVVDFRLFREGGGGQTDPRASS